MATRSRSRSRSRSSDNQGPGGRLEPAFLRAAENDDVAALQSIIAQARTREQLNDNFLRIGLMRSAEKGKFGATQYLLAQGAKPDGAPGNRLSPLLRAVERDHAAIVQLLLGHGADRETRDKKGRTALMTAAWLNHYNVLSLLIAKGADVNGKDNKGRNVLHNLAADPKPKWGDEVIRILLEQNIQINGVEEKNQRTPLHWSCATGKIHLAEQLLTRSKVFGPKASVNAVGYREKTGLHLAADHDRDDIVKLLLEHGARVNQTSDGNWTALHNACERGSVQIVRILLEAGAELNAKLLNGMSPLHLAAQGGHMDVVKHLLACKDIKRAQRDNFGFTPFLRAAQRKEKDIVHLLAPFNQVKFLSEDALGACNGFNATIVDFGDFRNENRVTKHTVYELLYGRDAQNPRRAAVTVLPNPKEDKATKFRWIHLPANNMAWVEALLTKAFIEEGANDVEGFKALEKSFSNQHRGQQSHSHFMRPLCQSTVRAPRQPQPEPESFESPTEPETPRIVINGGPDAHFNHSPQSPQRSSSRENRGSKRQSSPMGKENFKPGQKEKTKKEKSTPKGNRSVKAGNETPTKEVRSKQKQPFEPRPSKSFSRKEAQSSKSNIFTFMPYLHFETHRRRQEMQEAIKRAEKLKSPSCPRLSRATTYDEMLIRAHLATSNVSLHVRRTLDQSFYHNIDTGTRDDDQVVFRYQTKGQNIEDEDCDPKVVMVDTLWMWVLGKDLIISSFAQRWQQPKNDPWNVLDSIIEDINSKTRDPVNSVYDLSLIITNRCSGGFNRQSMGDQEYQILDLFESSLGDATDKETALFRDFNIASRQASDWLRHHRRPNRFSRWLEGMSREERDAERDKQNSGFLGRREFVDKLLDIGEETDLLAETKDIRDELSMIKKVLEDQRQVLPDLQAAICEIYLEEQISKRDVDKRINEQLKAIDMHINDVERMDKQALRIYVSITDMLDLKQKHANAFEARFARDQAAGTARQSQTIMVFTIVTIVFLPLSFIAAFFTINIREFPTSASGNQSLPLAYVSKYMFGIGFAISIPLVFIALVLDDVGEIFRVLRAKMGQRRRARRELQLMKMDSETTFDGLKMEQILSTAKSGRRSRDTGLIEERLSRDTAGSRERQASPRKVVTGFRMRPSYDIERGIT